ncbi:MAG TPA: HAD family hydrolase [Ornithinimicrobium sp.]|uniref:HAD family hydrolase n=1 Tax=Ornithinimicrobium sp. TaxID=1977084 RepID=UPI002B477B74|nr:HAD family hydrolase [Ornithinimicrobium sp.]HKJ11608.1 HAD family hydrolase [Ornithinimicrobium sp.]
MTEAEPAVQTAAAGGAGADCAAVIFDWGGTLTPWHTVDVLDIWHRTFAHPTHPDDPEAARDLARTLLEFDAMLWARGREEHRSSTFEEVLSLTSERTGLARSILDTESNRNAYAQAWEPYTWTDPHVLPLWTWLREQGIAVGVLSNTIWSREYHRGLFERDGVLHLIDGDVYSSEMPWVKPHAAAFHAAAAAVGAAAEACVYVGDRLYEDIWGPQQIGMRTIHIPHSTLPQEQVVPVDTQPHAVAHTVAEVAGIVSGWRGDAVRSTAQP